MNKTKIIYFISLLKYYMQKLIAIIILSSITSSTFADIILFKTIDQARQHCPAEDNLKFIPDSYLPYSYGTIEASHLKDHFKNISPPTGNVLPPFIWNGYIYQCQFKKKLLNDIYGFMDSNNNVIACYYFYPSTLYGLTESVELRNVQ